MPSPGRYPYNMPTPFAGAGGIYCDGFELNDGVENVLRQPVCVGDPNTWANAAAVAGAALAGTEMGMAARTIESPPNSAGATSQTAVGTSAVQITSGSPSPNRRKLKVKNTGGEDVVIGFTSGVTTGTGYPLASGETDNFDIGPALALYAIAAMAGGSVAVWEAG